MAVTLTGLIFRSVEHRKDRARYVTVVKGFDLDAPDDVHLVSCPSYDDDGRSVGLYSMRAVSDVLLSMHKRGFELFVVGGEPFHSSMSVNDVFALLNEKVREHLPRPKPKQVTFSAGQLAPIW